MAATSAAPASGSASVALFDPLSVLGRWFTAASNYAANPFQNDKSWIDYVLLIIIGATIVFFWNRILAAHVPDIIEG